MNTQHPNMSFTFEVENNNSLAFLDINVQRLNDCFETSIYRKPTFSGVYLHFTSYMPLEYKLGLISTLLHRCFALVSSYENFHLDLLKLKEIINQNGYPIGVIDNCIKKFLTKKYTIKPVVQTVAKKNVSLFLPYLGKASLVLRTDLIKLFANSLPFCKIRVVFKSGNRLGNCFSFKDRIPKSLTSGVVYNYKCGRCNSAYIGKTKRHWEKRLEEHLSISALTGKPLKCFKEWPPKVHSKKCNSDISRDNFSFICRENNDFLLRIKESISIYNLNPSLNTQCESTKLYLYN